ncbi:hypothetical protein [Candidatus Harpocratesius sp.]
MPRMQISMTRFHWKIPRWRDLQNVRAIWFYSLDGIPSFELEIDPSIIIPENLCQHARNSKNIDQANFIVLKNVKIISIIGKKIKTLEIMGARGKSIFLGNIIIHENNKKFNIPLYSTLEDWHDFKEHTSGKLYQHTSHVKFT